MGTKKRLLVSLAMAMALVMMMSACAMAQPGPMPGNSWTNVDIDENFASWSYSDFDASWTDSSTDNDLIDLDKSKLSVDLDMDTINAPGNQGNIVNDSEEVAIIGISNINFTLTNATSYSGNFGSFNEMVVGSGNTTVIGSMNTTTMTSNFTNQEFCNNTLDIAVDNVLNDYSQTTITKDITDVDVSFKGIGNTVGSYNDAFCDNDSYSTDITNIKSFNNDCDLNDNAVIVDLPISNS